MRFALRRGLAYWNQYKNHPRRPIGYYIPAANGNTAKRWVNTAGVERCNGVIQTINVEVDDRGYIYIVDRAHTGMHILELAGPVRAIAALK